MWFEGTFALTVMETWERWVVCESLSSPSTPSRRRSILALPDACCA
jgi:hypothetical protein